MFERDGPPEGRIDARVRPVGLEGSGWLPGGLHVTEPALAHAVRILVRRLWGLGARLALGCWGLRAARALVFRVVCEGLVRASLTDSPSGFPESFDAHDSPWVAYEEALPRLVFGPAPGSSITVRDMRCRENEGMHVSQEARASAAQERELVCWRVHPVARSRGKAAFVISTIVALTLASALYAGAALGVVALLLLGGSLWPFFVPTTYRLTTWGVTQERWPTRQRRPWSAFRRFQVDRRGVLLSPFPRPSRLDSFRGMYLLTDGGVDAEGILKEMIGPRPERE